MAEFLSDEWIAALDAAARAVTLPEQMTLVVQEVIVDADGAERAFALRIEGGAARVLAGRVEQADVTLTQDAATAAAIARGELSAQAAFLAGRVRLGGDAHGLVDRARELEALDGAFDGVRAATTWNV